MLGLALTLPFSEKVVPGLFPPIRGLTVSQQEDKMLCPSTEMQMTVSFVLSHHSSLTLRLACQPKSEEHSGPRLCWQTLLRLS